MTREAQRGGYEGPRELLCDEAQADGVPCTELGKECETCERAHPRPDSRDSAHTQADGDR